MLSLMRTFALPAVVMLEKISAGGDVLSAGDLGGVTPVQLLSFVIDALASSFRTVPVQVNVSIAVCAWTANGNSRTIAQSWKRMGSEFNATNLQPHKRELGFVRAAGS
jgi:hypothetical protein